MLAHRKTIKRCNSGVLGDLGKIPTVYKNASDGGHVFDQVKLMSALCSLDK